MGAMKKTITAAVLTAATLAGGAAVAAPAQAAPGYPSGTAPVRPTTTLPVYPSSSGSAVLEAANVTASSQLEATYMDPTTMKNLEQMIAGSGYVADLGFDVSKIMKFKPVR